MWLQIKENVLAPLARRAGTATGALLVAAGHSEELAKAVSLLVVAALLVLLELLWSKSQRTKEVNREVLRVNQAATKYRIKDAMARQRRV